MLLPRFPKAGVIKPLLFTIPELPAENIPPNGLTIICFTGELVHMGFTVSIMGVANEYTFTATVLCSGHKPLGEVEVL
jgi:hypothetical protein